MISDFSSGDMTVLLILLVMGSIAIGWITEGILQNLAFGMFGNAVLAFIGAFGAILALDHAITKHWVPRYLPVEPEVLWIATASLGAIFMILAPLFLRRIVIR